ncbi:DUF1972 domain-containing protein [Photobacterium sanguinicancri]|uniref:DUF1972 domain-containing protein n=1 Tax=Photobacterium sanguinicancri TaxID=875932 RepID=UPI003D11B521
MTKVAIVGIVGLPASYGGFESLAENLVCNKSDNISYTVFCSAGNYPEKIDYYNGAKLKYLPLSANGIQSVPYDILSLIECLKLKPDTILILGVSGCIFLPIFKMFSHSRVITNIDGIEWKREKWNWLAKKFLKLSEFFAVKFSDVIVTDNQAITDYVKQEYGALSSTIAYGGDHAIRNLDIKQSKYEYALGLCRIEPENNVDKILEAFSKVNERIKFIGNWNSSDYGKNLKLKYEDYNNIELLDPIYDLDSLYEIRKNCKFYVHGHSAGGTNPSLVEMMHFGVPILAFDCVFNRYTTEDKALYFANESDLVAKLNGYPNEARLNEMALAMQEIAAEKYTWVNVVRKYEGLF